MSTNAAAERSAAFKLSEFCVHLDHDGGVRALDVDDQFWGLDGS